MNLLQALAATKRVFRGEGLNHEKERFTGELRVEVLTAGAALLLRYRAVLHDGSTAHEEATLLARGPDGRPTLWPVMSELEVVLPHPEVATSRTTQGGLRSVFASGPREDDTAFREEITIELHVDGEVTYAHAWGLPGGRFEDRSSCRMAPAGR